MKGEMQTVHERKMQLIFKYNISKCVRWSVWRGGEGGGGEREGDRGMGW